MVSTSHYALRERSRTPPTRELFADESNLLVCCGLNMDCAQAASLIGSVEATAIDHQKLLTNMQQLYDHEASDAYLKMRSGTLPDDGMPVTVVKLRTESLCSILNGMAKNLSTAVTALSMNLLVN